MKELNDYLEYARSVGFYDPENVDVAEAFYRALDKRISKLEGGIVASADALAALEYRHLKRLTALEGDGEDNAEVIQDHQLRLTDLEECALEECQKCAERPYIEAEKKTCGECKYPWSRQGWGDPKDWVLVCDYEDGVNGEYRARPHGQLACPSFEAIQ